jgi:tRNA threonylcarbamoyladenosine biosynthesis protein TsaE
MNLKLNSPSPDNTFDIGKKLGLQLRGKELILLIGELGAGKTLMTKGIASSLGVNPNEIVSPTFTLMNQFEYSSETQKRREGSIAYFIHFDCYRFADRGNAGEKPRGPGLIIPEIDEWIDEAIVAVEWAQYLHPSYFSLPRSIRVSIKIETHQTRNITIESALDYL